MSYTPPTPTLPEGEEMQKVLDAFAQLPQARFTWGGDRNATYLYAEVAGRKAIVQHGEHGFTFRSNTGGFPYMADAGEIKRDKPAGSPFGGLDNPAAIALASAWMVPLLVKEVREWAAQSESFEQRAHGAEEEVRDYEKHVAELEERINDLKSQLGLDNKQRGR